MFARGIIVLLCGLVAISDGAREPDCKYPSGGCLDIDEPVCGSDGITYSNECELCAAIKDLGIKILIQNEGPCVNAQTDDMYDEEIVPDCKDYPDVCPEILSPVCGSDGITYDNECMLCAAIKASGTQILIQYEGPCDPEE